MNKISKLGLIITILGLLSALIPVFSVLLTFPFTQCNVNEAGPTPCVIFGIDIGGVLAFLGVMGWLFVITFPVGGLAIIIGLGISIYGYLKRRNEIKNL